MDLNETFRAQKCKWHGTIEITVQGYTIVQAAEAPLEYFRVNFALDESRQSTSTLILG